MYFLQLSETNLTINLGQIAMVEWDYVGDATVNSAYTTTVTLANGIGFYITRNDARMLWKALQQYNARNTPSLQAVSAGNGNRANPNVPPQKTDF